MEVSNPVSLRSRDERSRQVKLDERSRYPSAVPKVPSTSTVLSTFGSVEGLRDPVKPSQAGRAAGRTVLRDARGTNGRG